MLSRLEARFAGRILGVATQHGKERVIGPALSGRLPLAGVRAIEDLDTDRFGAFSGEVARGGTPAATALAKAAAGATVSGLDLVIASEGTFAPHPEVPWLSCDEEILVLLDLRDGTNFEHRHVSLDAVFGAARCTSLREVRELSVRLGFPVHQLVLRPRKLWQPGDAVFKGVGDPDRLAVAAEWLLSHGGECWVESDLRACANPTRMNVIARSAEEFADALAYVCPVCAEPWFRVSETRAGLPCSLCGLPTRSALHYVRACRVCGHTRSDPRPDARTEEEPRHCDHCNP